MSAGLEVLLSIAGQEGHATVASVRGHEGLGEPFRYTIEFFCPFVDPQAARGAPIVLEFADGARTISGVVETLELEALSASETLFEGHLYRVTVVPRHRLVLANRRGFRIFQDKTVVEIIEEIMADAGIDEASVSWDGVTGTYPSRIYTVQYDETEWDFIGRLMEEQGIYYTFAHLPDSSEMVMMDANAAFVATDPASLSHDMGLTFDAEPPGVMDWSSRARIVESTVTLRDYDFERPSVDISVEATADEAIPREHYSYPGRYTDEGEGARLAQVRLDAFRSERTTAECHTNLLSATPGQFFALLDHLSFDGEHVIRTVDLDIGRPQHQDAGTQPGFTIRLGTFPKEQTFRASQRTPRPRVIGLQTATVAGPTGEEIHVDRFGRIKLQFFWDRDGTGDDKASCWIRLTQGHTTGSVQIPRIGWEVFVEFIDGDPDRPVCMSRVWNTAAGPPHPLPSSKTKSSHGSVSTPGSGGVNEVVLDDAAGSETFAINAQFNQTTVVANNQTTSVGADLTHKVSATRTVDIGGNETRVVEADEAASVTGDHTIDVGGTRKVSASGTATEETSGGMAKTVGGMENIIVGSPASAVLSVVAEAAIAKVSGAAASAASRAEAALLGPIAPALDAARGALGSASEFAGNAAGMLGPGAPQIPGLAEASAALNSVSGAMDVGAMAGGFAQSALTGALDSAMGGGGGGGGPAGASGASGGGSGSWATTVGGDVTESVGGVAALTAVKDIMFKIGGDNTELVGAARVEMIKGGKNENTGAAKVETVGIYKVKVGESYGVEAKAAVGINISGTSSHDIGGGHSIATEGAVMIKAGATTLEASTITLACGACKVVVDSGGISVEGATEVTLKGTIEMPSTALGT